MSRDVQPVVLSNEKEMSPVNTSNLLNNNIWETFTDSADVLVKSLKLGRVRGIVDIVNFPDFKSQGYSDYVVLIQDLVSRDILVTVSGFENSEMDTAGIMESDLSEQADEGLVEFCNFIGIQPILYIPRDTEQAAITAFYNDLSLNAGIQSTELPVAAITYGEFKAPSETFCKTFKMENSPVETADVIDHHIHDKRTEVQWCDRCGGRFSPFS